MNFDYRQAYIASHYGIDVEQAKCCEECAELIEAITEHIRNPTPETLKHVLEERIDVEITLHHLDWLFGWKSEEMMKQWNAKLDRQIKRIEKENGKRFSYV